MIIVVTATARGYDIAEFRKALITASLDRWPNPVAARWMEEILHHPAKKLHSLGIT